MSIHLRNKTHWTRLPRYLCNLLRSLYYLKGIIYIKEDIFLQNSFLQSKISRISSDRDCLQKWNPQFIVKLNWKNKWFKKKLCPWFLKEKQCGVCVFFSKFSCKWDRNYKKAWKQPFKNRRHLSKSSKIFEGQ